MSTHTPHAARRRRAPAAATGGWEGALLAAIGAPRTANNISNLQAWAASEGMPASEHNPLATTEPAAGATTVNSAGVRSYPTPAAGILATAQTLKGSAYAPIVQAFRDNAPRADVWKAINASPWCAGCQNGYYPEAMVGPGGSKEAVEEDHSLEEGLSGGLLKGGAGVEFVEGAPSAVGKAVGAGFGAITSWLTKPFADLLINGVLLLAGAAMLVYGIMLAVRPKGSGLPSVKLPAMPIPVPA